MITLGALGALGSAWAVDPMPTVFTPSSAPGDLSGVEVQARLAARGAWGPVEGTFGAVAHGRWGRLVLGGELLTAGEGYEGPVGTGWVGVAVVDRPGVRVLPWIRGGTTLQAGVALVARTPGGGVGGHGIAVDLSWGPAWDTHRLVAPSWRGPFDPVASLPELGVTVPIHPRGTQHLRLGAVGPMPTVTWRGETLGLVVESSAGGLPGTGGVFTLAVGARGF